MFRALIEVGLMVLFICVTPIALQLFEFAGPDMWRVSSWIAVTMGALLTVWRVFLVRSRLVAFPREAPVFMLFTLANFVLLLGNALVWQTA